MQIAFARVLPNCSRSRPFIVFTDGGVRDENRGWGIGSGLGREV